MNNSIPSQPIDYIKELNSILTNKKTNSLTTEFVRRYFDNIRLVFLELFDEINAGVSEDKYRQEFEEICRANLLQAISLKFGYELPSDLEELAYDFDNSEYPGATYIINKIKAKSYLLQK